MKGRLVIAVVICALAGCGKRSNRFRFADSPAGRHLAELLPPARAVSWPLAPSATGPQTRPPSALERVSLLPPPGWPARPSVRPPSVRLELPYVSHEVVALAEFPPGERVSLPTGPLAQAPTLDPAALPPLPALPMPGEAKPSGRDDPTRALSHALRLTSPVTGLTDVAPLVVTLPDPETNQREIELRNPPADNDPPAP